MNTITASEAYKFFQEGALLLDVRSPAEYRAVHADGAALLPLDAVQSGEKPDVTDEKQPVLLLCKSGMRAKSACAILENCAPNPMHVVEGGTDAWVAAGLPHVTGKRVMSLERQVRIAAGALVVIGVILSQLVAPGFVWLSAFVGAGLVFAGITDTCGMGMLIAKCPWNR